MKIRTAKGLVGWVPEHDLLSADLWQLLKDLEARLLTCRLRRAATPAFSAIFISRPAATRPGSDKLNKDVPLDLLTRQSAEIYPVAPGASAKCQCRSTEESAGQTPGAKKEDWWLVRAHTTDQGVLAGWLLGRFIDLDVPAPLPDYASSAGTRIVAWEVLN